MNAIVAVDSNWAIGRDNDLLFSLPTDMKRFRTLTSGGTVIISQFYGGNDKAQVSNAVHTALALSIAGGLVMMAVGIMSLMFRFMMVGEVQPSGRDSASNCSRSLAAAMSTSVPST